MIICITFLLASLLYAQPAQIGRIGLPRTGRRQRLGHRPVQVGVRLSSSFCCYLGVAVAAGVAGGVAAEAAVPDCAWSIPLLSLCPTQMAAITPPTTMSIP